MVLLNSQARVAANFQQQFEYAESLRKERLPTGNMNCDKVVDLVDRCRTPTHHPPPEPGNPLYKTYICK
jgi:hypothetical protein